MKLIPNIEKFKNKIKNLETSTSPLKTHNPATSH